MAKLLGLKCGSKIKWRDSCSLSVKEGTIVKEYCDYTTIVDAIPDYYYDVIESNTDAYYIVREKDITSVNIDGKWKLLKHYDLDLKAVARDGVWQGDVKAGRGYIYSFKPKKVIFNGPATVVLWKDGTKTIVKRREGEEDDREKAVMYCILKKLCGNKASMDRYLKLFLKGESNNEEKKEADGGESDWKKQRAGSGSSEGTV